MQSFWTTLADGQPYGPLLKKLERLTHMCALDIERERLIWNNQKMERTSFLVNHAASSWNDLVLELLSVSRRICPVWTLAMDAETVCGDLFADVYGSSAGQRVRLAGLHSIKWVINLNQRYDRASWLNGSPNQW